MALDAQRHDSGSSPEKERRVRRSSLARRCGVAAVAVVALGACQRVGVAPPAPAASLAACGTPALATDAWRLVRDSAGVSYRMPEGFAERTSSEVQYREFTYDGEVSGRVMIGFSPGADYYVSLRRAPSPGMHEMSGCVAAVDGRQVVLQAWRTEGGAFRGGQRYDLYEAHALVPVEPTRTLFVTGGGSDPRFQQVLLAIARTVTVEP